MWLRPSGRSAVAERYLNIYQVKVIDIIAAIVMGILNFTNLLKLKINNKYTNN